MTAPFIGSEARASGAVTPYQLRSRHVVVQRDVYLPRGVALTATSRARAAWWWSGRGAVVAGRSAAALHGAKWVDDDAPAEILYDNRRPPNGIRTWSDRFEDDEVETVRGLVVTTPARTALDMACRYPVPQASRGDRRPGTSHHTEGGRRRDAGAESPQETRVRLTLVRAGFPRPETQIPVYDEYGQLVAVLDMGWREIMVGVDYEGEHHRMSRRAFDRAIGRAEAVTELGWDDVRITAADTDGSVIGRVGRAFARQRRVR